MYLFYCLVDNDKAQLIILRVENLEIIEEVSEGKEASIVVEFYGLLT